MQRKWMRFPNGRLWRVDENGYTEGTVMVPDSLSKGDLEDMLDAISEAATGSLAGLCDLSYRYLGQDIVAFAGSVADMLSEEDSEVCEVTDRAELIALLRAQYGIAEFEATHALDSLADPAYATSGALAECALPIVGTARQLRCPSHPEPCSYVRVVIDGLELAYWNQDEWQESPADVMGAIMGAARGGAPYTGQTVEPKRKLKQVVAVITFDDPEDACRQLDDAATWIEGSLGRPGGFIDVTAYASAADAAFDEKNLAGDFTHPAQRIPQTA